MTARPSSTRILADWFNSVSNPSYPEGSIPKLSVSAADITSITIATTNDGIGFALGGIGGTNNTIPEPSTWAMMIVGFAGLGYFGYGASRRRAAAAA